MNTKKRQKLCRRLHLLDAQPDTQARFSVRFVVRLAISF
jgi:hypothetical protein